MKKLLSVILCAAMLLTCLPVVGFAQGPSGGIAGLEENLKYSLALADDGYIGIAVDLYTYYAGDTDEERPVVVYVINTNTERIGTDSDYKIVNELINEKGFIVVVLDYKNNPKSVTPNLERSVHAIRSKIDDNGMYLNGQKYKRWYNYVVPSGYNIETDVYYWSIDKHGADGCLDWIVQSWNNDFRAVYGDRTITYPDGTTKKVSEVEAKDIYDCVKPDGSPLDLDLRMDIIYPTNPKKDVPVWLTSSSWETRPAVWSDYRTISTGFSFSGYAVAVFDYGYVPMAREDHYAYFDGNTAPGHITGDNYTYSVDMFTAVKSQTAVIRKIRWLADYESDKYHFDVNKIGVSGGSKGGLVTRMGSADPESLEELRYFSGHHGETRYENGDTEGDGRGENGTDIIRGGEQQPWLTYKDGSKIPSNAQFVYCNMGSGAEDINEGFAPMYASGSLKDASYGDYYAGIVNACRIYDIPLVNLDMPELAHQLVNGTGKDKDHGLEGYSTLFDTAHYWLRDDGAICEYIETDSGAEQTDPKDKITIKFSGPVDRSEIEKITIKNKTTNESAIGSWSASYGDTTWVFEPHNLKGGYRYAVNVPHNLKGKNGKEIQASKTLEFKVKNEENTNASLVASDSDMTLLKTDTADNKVYFVFDKDDFSDTKKVDLRFDVLNDAANSVMVYGADEINESDVSKSMKGELLGEVLLSGKAAYDIDVTDYVKNHKPGKIAFILEAKNKKEAKQISKVDFEDAAPLYNWGVKDTVTKEISSEKNTTDGGSKSLKVVKMNAENKMQPYIDRLPITLSNNILFKSNGKMEQSDLGRKFHYSMKVYDQTSRRLRLAVAPWNSNVHANIDWNANLYNIQTNANTWDTYEFDYRVQQDDIDANRRSVTMCIGAKMLDNQAIYIDDIIVSEDISDVKIADRQDENGFAPVLVTYPEIRKYLDAAEVSYVENADKADTVMGGENAYVSARAVSDLNGAVKTYAKFSLDGYNGKNAYISFKTKASNNGRIEIYGISDKEASDNWDSETINYLNAPANDRFGSGVLLDNVFEKAPIAAFDINGEQEFSVDVTKYAQYMKNAGAKYASLIFVNTKGKDDVIWQNKFDSPYASNIVMPGGGISRYGLSNLYNHSDTKDGLCFYMTPSEYVHERIRFNLLDGQNLTKDDVGRSFTLTYWAKSNKTGKFFNSLMNISSYDTTQHRTYQTVENINEWKKYTYDFTLTDTDIGESDGVIRGAVNFELSNMGVSSFDPVTLYIDDMTLTEKKESNVDIEFLNTAKVAKTVSKTDFNSSAWEVGKAKHNMGTNIFYDEASADCGYVAVSGCDWSTGLKITDEQDADSNGKAFWLVPNQNYNRVKFYGLFDHNLTEADIGRKLNVSFKIKSDSAGSFNFGLMSMLQRYPEANYCELGEGVSADVDASGKYYDYSTKLYKASAASISQAEVGTWKTVNYSITVDSTMLPKQVKYLKLDKTYDVAVALFSIIPDSSLIGKNVYIDDIIVTEPDVFETIPKPAKGTVKNFEDWSTGEVKSNMTGEIFEDDADVKNFIVGSGCTAASKFNVVCDEEQGNVFAVVPSNDYNRVKFYRSFDHILTSDDIGDTYHVSFKVKADAAGKFDYGFMAKWPRMNKWGYTTDVADDVAYDDNVYKRNVAVITEDEVGKWKEISFDITIDSNMVARDVTNSKGVTYKVGISLFGFIANADLVGKTLYFDDISITKADENADAGVLYVSLAAAIGSDGGKNVSEFSAAGASASAPENIRKTYMHFNGGDFSSANKAELSFNIDNALGQTINIYAVKNAQYPAELTYNNAPANGDAEDMDINYIFKEAKLATVKADKNGSVSADVTDYIKNNKEYIFALTSNDAAAKQYLNLDFERYSFNKGCDYTPYGNFEGSADIAGGVLEVGGITGTNSGINILNVFGNGQTCEKGKTYTVKADIEPVGDKESYSVTIALSNGNEISQTAASTYVIGANQNQTIELTFTASEDDVLNNMSQIAIFDSSAENMSAFKLDNVTAESDGAVIIEKHASIEISAAKEPEIKEDETAQITLSTTGDSITADGENVGANSTKDYAVGRALALSANGEGTFMYWKDADSGLIVSYNKDYEFTVGSARKLIAIFAENGGAYVTFKNINGFVMAEGFASSLTVPKDPYVYGYEFAGWYVGNNEKTSLKAGESIEAYENTVYFAGFGKKDTAYKITVNGEEKTYSYNDKVTVSADAEKDGKTFSYWTKDGKAASYDKEYSFYATSDSVLEAVYGENAENKNVLVMANPVMADETRIAFFAERNISSDCEIIETGILMGKAEGLTLESASIKAVAKSKAQNGQYTVRKKGVVSGETWYAKAYVIYRDSTGSAQTIYSNEVSMTVK